MLNFENHLPSITRAADKEGWAEAVFTGTHGVAPCYQQPKAFHDAWIFLPPETREDTKSSLCLLEFFVAISRGYFELRLRRAGFFVVKSTA
ncbi:MAG: hypothetical protein MI861_21520 [Pirellulales bacterium]|nr:hypothetical protein [Pirellulales bacterium]